MRLKLFKKYFLTTAIVVFSSLAVMLLILVFVLNNYIATERQETLSVACNTVLEDIGSNKDSEFPTQAEVMRVVSTVADISESDIFICDSTGRVIVCSCEDYKQNENCLHTANNISKTEIEKIRESEELQLTKLGVYKKPRYVVAADLVDSYGEAYATVFAAAPTSMIKDIILAVTRLYVFSAILPLIIMLVVLYIVTYKMSKPLKLMSEAAHAMAKGDFSKRIPVTSDDEIGELSASFNMMTNNLSSLEGMRKSFVANVSHELKTPMTTIGGFIDGILDGTIEPEKRDYYLGIVSDEVKRLSRLVESMLSMSKLESGELAMKLELFDLRELIFTTVIGQEQRIEAKNLEIEGLDTLQSVSIKADKDLIHQVLYNLVDNAIKFTDEGGKIDFSLKNENSQIVFILTNTGKGIPSKDINFIFERFYKVDKSRSAAKNSTGIGLYIVKTIVKAHGGTIMVSSKENEQTSFKVTLPCNQ